MLYHVLWLIFGGQGDNDNEEICIYLLNKSPIDKSPVRTWSGSLGAQVDTYQVFYLIPAFLQHVKTEDHLFY